MKLKALTAAVLAASPLSARTADTPAIRSSAQISSVTRTVFQRNRCQRR